MALNDVTISLDLNQLLGGDIDTRRTRVYVKTNVTNGTLIDTSTGETRLGDERVTLEADGTGSFTTWGVGADGNPTSWQTSVVVEYPRAGSRDRVTRTFGPYTITDADDGKNLAELEDEQAIPPNYQSAFVADMEAIRDEAEAARDAAVDISNIDTSDDVVSTLIEGTAGAGPLTRSALSASYASKINGWTWKDAWVRDCFLPPRAADQPEINVAATSASGLGAGYVTYKPAVIGIGSQTNNWDGASDSNIRYGGGPGTTTLFQTQGGANNDLALYGQLKPGGTAQAATWPVIYEFQTVAPQIEIYTYHKAADRFLIEVNGKLTQETAYRHATEAPADGRITITFPQESFIGARRIRILALGNHGLSEIRVPNGYTIAKPAARSKTIAIIGDSWINGAGQTSAVDSLGAGVLRLIDPSADYIFAGIGSTGWTVGGNVGDPGEYSTRLATVLASSPSVLVFYGSQNDGNISVQTQVAAALSTSTAVPKIVVVPTLLSGYSTQASSIRSATLAAGRTYIDVAGLVAGSGYIDSPTNLAGNRSLYVNSVSDLHMDTDGHRMAREAIFRSIPDTVTA